MGDNLILVTCHQPSLKEALTARPAGINDWWLNVVCELDFITCGMVSTGLHSLLRAFFIGEHLNKSLVGISPV